MKKPYWSFVLALLLSALFLGAFVMLAGQGGFAFGRQATLRLLQTVAQYTAGLAALGLFVVAAVVAVRAALQPGPWWRRLLGVLPIFCLGLLLAGVLFEQVGIGTVGGFTLAWLTVSAVLAVVSVVVASALMVLDRASLRLASVALGVTGAFSILTWLAMIASVIGFLLTPTAGRGGPVGGGGAGGGGGGGFGPGGPGGPGGGRGSTTPLLIGAGLLTLFGILAWITIVRVWRSRRQPLADGATPAAPLSLSAQAGPATLSLAAVTALVFVAIQLVPVSKTNAPVLTPVTWNSPQDQALFVGACADCHSNETVRPWYDNVAPSSWLLASHISGAHARWNLSELGNLSSNAKKFLPNQIADALHFNIMPPQDYQFMHPAARLSDAEKEQLIAALKDVISK